MRIWRICLGTLPILLAASGCGTMETRMTVEQLTNARIAVEAAERADAKKLSPESLRHAQDALAIANDAYAGKEPDRAFAFAKRATIYARVAKAQSEQKQTEEKFIVAKERLEALRKQTESEMASVPGVYEPVSAAAQAAPAAVPAPESVPAAAPVAAPASGGQETK